MASGQELFSVAEGPPYNLEGLKYILKEHLSTLELVSMITSQNFLMINDDSNVG
jgi:hypothetical protein